MLVRRRFVGQGEGLGIIHIAKEWDIARRADRGLLDAGEQCDSGKQFPDKPRLPRWRPISIHRGIDREGNPDLARDKPVRIEPAILTQRGRETADEQPGASEQHRR